MKRDLSEALRQRRADGLYRQRRIVEGPQGPVLVVDGRPVLAFCANDYLGLANHPDIAAAFQAGSRRWGTGAGAAHLVSGHCVAHQSLEEELADFLGRPRALSFSTGYMANLGVVAVLSGGRRGRVFQDRYNHASLLDGALLAQARLQRYAHADVADLRRRLDAAEHDECLVASDGVFSMDGDLAPVPELAAACAGRAWLLIDDAHGIGVLGAQGRGSLEQLGCEDPRQVDALVGTLGKAAGVFGAFVAGGEDLIEALIQGARSYLYTTAPPPAVAEACRAALRLIRSEEGAARRRRLAELVAYLRRGAAALGLPLLVSSTPVQPLLVGSPQAAVALSARLLEAGIWVPAIRPPTVPPGTSRLRISLSAAHDEAAIDRLLETLARAWPEIREPT